MHCCICGRRLTGTLWVCRRCKTEHNLGRSIRDWPGWVRALRELEQDHRQQEAEWSGILSDSLDDVVFGPSPLGPYKGLHSCDDMAECDYLPNSPYTTKRDNQRYRKSNGILELD